MMALFIYLRDRDRRDVLSPPSHAYIRHRSPPELLESNLSDSFFLDSSLILPEAGPLSQEKNASNHFMIFK